MTGAEADAPTSTTVPYTPASAAGGGVAPLASAAGDRVAVLALSTSV
jgi:hypothetical protein